MLKRFFWASLFAIVPILVLVPFNHYLITNVHDFGEGNDQGSDRNFIALILIESLIIFLISFTLVNTYFNLHPLNKSISFSSRHTNENEKHPDIPEKYYSDTVATDERKEEREEK